MWNSSKTVDCRWTSHKPNDDIISVCSRMFLFVSYCVTVFLPLCVTPVSAALRCVCQCLRCVLSQIGTDLILLQQDYSDPAQFGLLDTMIIVWLVNNNTILPCCGPGGDHNSSSLLGPIGGRRSGLYVQIKSRDPIPATFRRSDTYSRTPSLNTFLLFSFHPKVESSLASRLQKCLISICQENSWRTMPSCSFMPQHMPAARSVW